MSYEIRISDTFKREAKALAKKYPSLKQDLIKLFAELAEKPDIGIALGNNMFNRMSITSKGRGKSGGARIITCVVYKREEVLLAEIYDKSDYATIDDQLILKNSRSEGFDI